MRFESSLFSNSSEASAGQFLETGTNRLARDLFLLTAVAALFMVMLAGMPLRMAAEHEWAPEAQLVEENTDAAGLTFTVHLRSDGRVQVGETLTETTDGVREATERIVREEPELQNANVVVSAYRNTASERTADVLGALEGGGLARERINLRFTTE